MADGLRYVSVTPKTAPTLWRIKSEGVDFTNSHSLYPTITTVNASAIATGHYIGDTGDFGNTIWSGNGGSIQFEDDAQLAQVNAHFGGNYLNETSLIAAAREAGMATAVMGKVGPTAIQDVTERDGTGTIVIDDAYGITVAPDVLDAIKEAGLSTPAPKPNAPNTEQQQYMVQVATKVVLPRLVVFRQAVRDALLVARSRPQPASRKGRQHQRQDGRSRHQGRRRHALGAAGVAEDERAGQDDGRLRHRRSRLFDHCQAQRDKCGRPL